MKRLIAIVFMVIFTMSFCTTALAELSGSNSIGPVSSSGTFTVEAVGSASLSRANLRVTSYNSNSSVRISIRVLKGTTCVYEGGILSGNSYIDCSLPAFSSKGIYTVEYGPSGSTYLKAEFNP